MRSVRIKHRCRLHFEIRRQVTYNYVRENTRRAEECSIKVDQQAKNQCMMKRGNMQDRQASLEKVEKQPQPPKPPPSSSKRQSLDRLSKKDCSIDRNSHSLLNLKREKDISNQSECRENRYDKEVLNVAKVDDTPLGLVSTYYGMFKEKAKFQLVEAKNHLRELSGPLNRKPEHIGKVRKDIDRILSRSVALGRELRALETKLGLFGYYGIEEPADSCVVKDDRAIMSHRRSKGGKDTAALFVAEKYPNKKI